MLMSTEAGDLYEVDESGSTRLGDLSGLAMYGLVATDASTLFGFSNNRGYVINVNDLTLTPQSQFGVLVFTVAGDLPAGAPFTQ